MACTVEKVRTGWWPWPSYYNNSGYLHFYQSVHSLDTHLNFLETSLKLSQPQFNQNSTQPIKVVSRINNNNNNNNINKNNKNNNNNNISAITRFWPNLKARFFTNNYFNNKNNNKNNSSNKNKKQNKTKTQCLSY